MAEQERDENQAVRPPDSVEHDKTKPQGTVPEKPGRRKRILKWIVFVVAILFFFGVLREAFDPFGDKPYAEIPHGDHVHYVPKDRDPNVPMGRFPTTKPGPDERITPDGRIVKKE